MGGTRTTCSTRTTALGRRALALGAVLVVGCGPQPAYLRLSSADLPRDTVYRCDAGGVCTEDTIVDTSRFTEAASTFDLSSAEAQCAHGIADLMVRDVGGSHPYVIFRCRTEPAVLEDMAPADVATADGES